MSKFNILLIYYNIFQYVYINILLLLCKVILLSTGFTYSNNYFMLHLSPCQKFYYSLLRSSDSIK